MWIIVANLSIYYTWKNNKSAYANKISAPTSNDQSIYLSVYLSIYLSIYLFIYLLHISDYFEYIIKNHETITINPPIQIYVNKIKNPIVLKIKTGFKLELLAKGTMKLLGSTKKSLTERKAAKMYEN